MAAKAETAAISIQRFEFGETSQIVHFLTEDLGRVVVLVKGAHRDKNSYQGSIDLLVRGRVRLTLLEGRELGLLTRRQVEWAYPELRRSLARYRAAEELLGLVRDTTPAGEGGGVVFRLFDRGLRALEEIEIERIPLLTLSFRMRLLAELGLAPSLESCVRCGQERAAGRFLPAEGGVVCRRCRTRPGEGLTVSATVRDLLAQLGRVRLAEIPRVAPAVLRDARRILALHSEYHLDRPELRH